jgi:hypothetical protein
MHFFVMFLSTYISKSRFHGISFLIKRLLADSCGQVELKFSEPKINSSDEIFG